MKTLNILRTYIMPILYLLVAIRMFQIYFTDMKEFYLFGNKTANLIMGIFFIIAFCLGIYRLILVRKSK